MFWACVTLSCGAIVPSEGFGRAFADALPQLVKDSQVELRRRQPRFRCKQVPVCRFLQILLNAITTFPHNAHHELRVSVIARGEVAEDRHGLLIFAALESTKPFSKILRGGRRCKEQDGEASGS